jgi:putative nucleotidyltransferase with HDIG domain
MDALRAPDSELFDQELFWAHSVCVGLAAEAIARETRVARPEDAFTAGVLHDIGKLAMIIVAPDDFAEAVDLVTHEDMSYREAEVAVFGVNHQQVGTRLAQRWKFPEPLVAAIRDHHPARRSSAIESLGDIAAAADLACNRRGLACGWDYTRRPERWPVEALPPRAEEAIARLHGGMDVIEERARAFLLHVTARPPRWYEGTAVRAAEEAAA